MAQHRAPRLHLPAGLAAGCEIELEPARAHYLRSVLRLGPGAAVAAFNAEDGEWLCRIADIGKNDVRLTAERQLRFPEHGGAPDLWVVFAPIKRTRLDWLVEKATELGVSALLPTWTVRTQVERVNLKRRSAQLELAAGLQRDRTSSVVGQSDRIAVLDNRLPSETSHLAQHRADPIRSLIRDPAQIRAPEDELFVLCANAPRGRRLAAGFEVLDKLPLVGDRRSRRTRSGRHPRRYSSGNVAAARLSNR